MNNNNIVKIGTALKWRNTYDPGKKYYQENIVSACGCVFRCKIFQSQGQSPVQTVDEEGHLGFANTDVWDVVVDMAYYYNFCVDTNNLTRQTLAYVKLLDETCQRQQTEIDALGEISDEHGRILDEHAADLNGLHDNIDRFKEDARNALDEINTTFNFMKEEHQQFKDTHSEFEAEHEAFKQEHQEFKELHEQFEAAHDEFKTLHAQYEAKIKSFEEEHEDFQREHEQFKQEHEAFQNECDQFKSLHESYEEEHQAFVAEHENIHNRIDDILSAFNKYKEEQGAEIQALKSQCMDLSEELARQIEINEAQQKVIDSIKNGLGITNEGAWNDNLLWNNNALWPDVLTMNIGCGCASNRVPYTPDIEYDDVAEAFVINTDGYSQIEYDVTSETIEVKESRMDVIYQEEVTTLNFI